MYTGVTCLGIAGALSEMQVLTGKHGLGGHIVGIHPLPATGQRTAVENHLQTEVIGIGENILVELHHGLFVTAEEVHLDTEDAVLLHPGHLLTTRTALVHLVLRTLRSIVPGAIGVVPQEQSHATLLAIACQLLHLLIAYLRVPEGIDKH